MGSCRLLVVCSGQAPVQMMDRPEDVHAEEQLTPLGLPGHHADTCWDLWLRIYLWLSSSQTVAFAGTLPGLCQGLWKISMLWVNQVCCARSPRAGIGWLKVTGYYSSFAPFFLWLWVCWKIGTPSQKGELEFGLRRTEWVMASVCKRQVLTWILIVKKHCLKSLERWMFKRMNRNITWERS